MFTIDEHVIGRVDVLGMVYGCAVCSDSMVASQGDPSVAERKIGRIRSERDEMERNANVY